MTDLPPRYVADITAADVESALAFLLPRIEAELKGRYGTPGFRIAFALDHLVRQSAGEVRWRLRELAEDNFPNRLAQIRGTYALRDAWNRLWEALYPWKDDKGYDSARWRHIDHIDAKTEAEERERDEAYRARLATEQVYGANSDTGNM